MSNEEVFDRISKLKNHITKCLYGDCDLPETFFFSTGFPNPNFKITIECVECDEVIDLKGQKWIKVKK